MNWIVGKAKEGSTWAAIAAFVGSLTFLPHFAEIDGTIKVLAVAIPSLLGVWFK